MKHKKQWQSTTQYQYTQNTYTVH